MGPSSYTAPGHDFAVEHDATPPTTTPHGTDNEIRKNLTPLKATNWRMEGNQLIADTDYGRLVQRISTDVICKGTDKYGLPILEPVVLS